MEKLIMGTTNPAKISQLNGCLSLIGIKVVGVENKSILPTVEEDGKTVAENARKKAIVYAAALGHRVISMDNALYIDGLPADKQPGLHVRRLNGVDANSDDELLLNGQKLISSLGGRATGYWHYGVCVADPNGEYWETDIKTPRVFSSNVSKERVEGYPLESIQIDPQTGKYISEMSQVERDEFWQRTIGQGVIKLVQSIN